MNTPDRFILVERVLSYKDAVALHDFSVKQGNVTLLRHAPNGQLRVVMMRARVS